ncbi:MAG: formimidoylglutamase [Gemmatimonadota bacterium]
MDELLTPPPADVGPPETADDDPRLGHLIASDPAELKDAKGPDRPAAVLVGFPSDEGVRRNGGRPGAAEAPTELRRRLYGLTPDARTGGGRMERLLRRTLDAGDVRVTGDVEADQERLGEVVGRWLSEGAFVVVLGGGHETAFGHFLGHVAAGLEPEILNWDAHPDVRPVGEGGAHSGSPFRQALLHPSGACRGYTVAGLLPHAVSAAHRRFLEERGCEVVWRARIGASTPDELFGGLSDPALASFDLDAVDQAWAPGVSAPAAGGLDPEVWLAAAEAAGRAEQVRSVDVVELNPRFDPDGRTARLAAVTVWRLLRGLADRQAG